MMKITMMISFLIGSLTFSSNSFAQSELNKVLKKEEQNQSTAKKRRRKKVEMCQECGKPETECECEGHGHKDHDDHKSHKGHHKDELKKKK